MIKKQIKEILNESTPLRYLLEFRKTKKMNEAEFSEFLGKSRRIMNYYFSGKRAIPNEIILTINRIKERQ